MIETEVKLQLPLKESSKSVNRVIEPATQSEIEYLKE